MKLNLETIIRRVIGQLYSDLVKPENFLIEQKSKTLKIYKSVKVCKNF